MLLNTLSEAEIDAGMHKYFLASIAKTGQVDACTYYYLYIFSGLTHFLTSLFAQRYNIKLLVMLPFATISLPNSQQITYLFVVFYNTFLVNLGVKCKIFPHLFGLALVVP